MAKGGLKVLVVIGTVTAILSGICKIDWCSLSDLKRQYSLWDIFAIIQSVSQLMKNISL
jgi:hypothetical protein